MADEKISDMLPVGHCEDADILPMVQGGLNVKVAKSVFLTGGTGEAMVITENSSHTARFVSSTGNASVGVQLNQAFVTAPQCSMTGGVAAESFVLIDSSGNATVRFKNGQAGKFSNEDEDAGLFIDNAGGTVEIKNGSGVIVWFVDSTPANWASSPPPDMQAALIRISAAVAGLLGTPIP